jgi:hypothetical protein
VHLTLAAIDEVAMATVKLMAVMRASVDFNMGTPPYQNDVFLDPYPFAPQDQERRNRPFSCRIGQEHANRLTISIAPQ